MMWIALVVVAFETIVKDSIFNQFKPRSFQYHNFEITFLRNHLCLRFYHVVICQIKWLDFIISVMFIEIS